MRKFFQKPFAYAIVSAVFLTAISLYVLLQTYLISTVEEYVTQSEDSSDISYEQSGLDAEINDMSYKDNNMKISIKTVRKYETNIYIADVTLSSAEFLKTALANNAFGSNVTQKTSEIAQEKNAILAINGDYYGANRKGYVIKSGVLYRDSVKKDSEYDDLIIYKNGAFEIINENEISAQSLVDSGVQDLLSFGPALIKNGNIAVSEGEEVGKAMSENPRTAIGIIGKLHYIMLVSDGRTNESGGLSLYQTAEIMQQYGCQIAYNLDGGGSSTMYFNGRIINNPTTNGRKISERAVSDIVYIGY